MQTHYNSLMKARTLSGCQWDALAAIELNSHNVDTMRLCDTRPYTSEKHDIHSTRNEKDKMIVESIESSLYTKSESSKMLPQRPDHLSEKLMALWEPHPALHNGLSLTLVHSSA